MLAATFSCEDPTEGETVHSPWIFESCSSLLLPLDNQPFPTALSSPPIFALSPLFQM